MSTTTKISLDQYRAMIDRGEFEPPHHRVELIRGELVPKDPDNPMSPAKLPHRGTVIALTMWSVSVILQENAVLSVQNGFEIAELDSMPDPDLAWLLPKDYTQVSACPEDVLLAIEVSDSSLRKDRKVKSPLYAEAGIRDYWIVNVPARCIEVFRDPEDGVYRTVTAHGAGEEIRPLAFPDLVLPVARIFPARACPD